MKEETKDSLIKESKKVSHDNDDSPRQSDDDLLDLVHPLGGVLDFWNTGTERTSLNLLRTRQHGARGAVPDLAVHSEGKTAVHSQVLSTGWALRCKQRIEHSALLQVNSHRRPDSV